MFAKTGVTTDGVQHTVKKARMQIDFCVDDQTICCQSEELTASDFTVKSTPSSYSVHYENNDAVFFSIFSELKKNNSVLLIDKNLIDLYQPVFAIEDSRVFVLSATEKNKTLSTVRSLIDFMQKNKMSKSDCLIVVGGGVTQEIGAFASAIYKRGIKWIYFPTTLLSMCDSCLGGKASLNDRGVKNQLGLYSNPSRIIINTTFLKTLPEREIKSGLGEIVKSCLIGGNYFLKQYQDIVKSGRIVQWNNIKQLIHLALLVKKKIIEIDPFELSIRKCLNYGHTVGHAIESATQYKLTHGQCVAIGMIYVNRLCDIENKETLNALCSDLVSEAEMQIIQSVSVDRLIELIQEDKKVENNVIKLVILCCPGKIIFKEYDFKSLQIAI